MVRKAWWYGRMERNRVPLLTVGCEQTETLFAQN
jgi:hypothetical protein